MDKALLLLATVLVKVFVVSALDAPTSGCGDKPTDVVFILDSSNSIWTPNFRRQVEFVANVVEEFQIGDDAMKVGLVTFSHRARLAFPLKQSGSKEAVLGALDDLEQDGGLVTYTSKAIELMRKQCFTKRRGGRENVTRIAILISDGQTTDPIATAYQAHKAKMDGVHIFAVGVGDHIDMNVLRHIASKPSKFYLVTSKGYEGLEHIRDLVAVKTCTVTNPPSTQSTTTSQSPIEELDLAEATASMGQDANTPSPDMIRFEEALQRKELPGGKDNTAPLQGRETSFVENTVDSEQPHNIASGPAGNTSTDSTGEQKSTIGKNANDNEQHPHRHQHSGYRGSSGDPSEPRPIPGSGHDETFPKTAETSSEHLSTTGKSSTSSQTLGSQTEDGVSTQEDRNSTETMTDLQPTTDDFDHSTAEEQSTRNKETSSAQKEGDQQPTQQMKTTEDWETSQGVNTTLTLGVETESPVGGESETSGNVKQVSVGEGSETTETSKPVTDAYAMGIENEMGNQIPKVKKEESEDDTDIETEPQKSSYDVVVEDIDIPASEKTDEDNENTKTTKDELEEQTQSKEDTEQQPEPGVKTEQLARTDTPPTNRVGGNLNKPGKGHENDVDNGYYFYYAPVQNQTNSSSARTHYIGIRKLRPDVIQQVHENELEDVNKLDRPVLKIDRKTYHYGGSSGKSGDDMYQELNAPTQGYVKIDVKESYPRKESENTINDGFPWYADWKTAAGHRKYFTRMGCAPKSSLDLVFVIDSDNSEYQSKSHHIWRIVREVVSRLNMDKGNVRVQFVTECPKASHSLASNLYSDKHNLLQALKDVGETPRRTVELLGNMITKLESSDESDRWRKVGLYLTDGKAGDLEAVQDVSRRAKQEGIEMFGVGIGDGVDQDELEAVASCQYPFHLFTHNHREVGRLTDAARKIARQLCSHLYESS